MSSTEMNSSATKGDQGGVSSAPGNKDNVRSSDRKVTPLLITLGTVALAAPLTWAMWEAYMDAPWTRDGQVRAYVVTMAPEVAGRIVGLAVADNQFVHKGDPLVTIDPTDYRIAVSLAEATVQQALINSQNLQAEAKRPTGRPYEFASGYPARLTPAWRAPRLRPA